MSAAAPGSVWSVHAGHLLLLAAWAVGVAGSLAWTRIRDRRAHRATEARGPVVDRDRWVAIACLASVASGAVHVAVIREHFAESALYGTFFLVLALLQFAWAAGMAFRPVRSVLAAGAFA